MRKYLFIAIAAVVLAACSSSEQQAKSYLKELYPGAGFKVDKVGKEIKLYNPHAELMTIAQRKLQYTKREITLDEYTRSSDTYVAAVQDPIGFAQEHPDKCNTTGLEVWIEKGTQYFRVFLYYGAHDHEIVTSTPELEKEFVDLMK